MQVEHFPHIFWCRCCGGISSKQAKLLVAACRGRPSEWGEYVVNCMSNGLLPKSVFQPHKVWVGDSVLYIPNVGDPVFSAARGLTVV